MRQPSQALEKIDMVTCTVGIQTSCPSSPSYTHSNILAKVETTCPSHFTEIHITKLEDAFSKRQKPDEIQLQILAMECNLLYKDVRDWFKARRLKWIQDLVKDDLCISDKNNNNDSKAINTNNITIDKGATKSPTKSKKQKNNEPKIRTIVSNT